jgi:hypothetical protein
MDLFDFFLHLHEPCESGVDICYDPLVGEGAGLTDPPGGKRQEEQDRREY